MKWDFTRIESQNARDTNEDRVHLQTRPIVRPFLDVHYGGVVLRHIELPDTPHSLMPRDGCLFTNKRTGGQNTGNSYEAPTVDFHKNIRSASAHELGAAKTPHVFNPGQIVISNVLVNLHRDLDTGRQRLERSGFSQPA